MHTLTLSIIVKLWFGRYRENHHPLKIADLRQVLDKYSIFAGRNIFDIPVRIISMAKTTIFPNIIILIL